MGSGKEILRNLPNLLFVDCLKAQKYITSLKNKIICRLLWLEGIVANDRIKKKKISLSEVSLVLPDAATVESGESGECCRFTCIVHSQPLQSHVCFCIFWTFMFLFRWLRTVPAMNRKTWWIPMAGVIWKMPKAEITLITVHSFLLSHK